MPDINVTKQSERNFEKAPRCAEGIIEAISDILLEVDRNGRYLNVWTEDPDMLARSREALIGRTVRDVFPPQQAAALVQAIQEADRDGGASGRVISLESPDGARRWFEHSLAKKSGATPAVDTFLLLSRDVTPRWQADQPPDAELARLRSVLQTIPDMIWLKDADGAYLACNRAFERLAGKRAPEIVGKTDHSLFDAELADFLCAKDRATIEARRTYIDERRVTYPDTGERALLETRKVPVFDADGNVTGVLAVARDITAHKGFEEMLTHREREFRTLVEHSPDMIIRYSRDFRHLYVNPIFAALLEVDASALIGKRGGGPQSIFYEQKLGEVFASGEDLEFELKWNPKDGRELCHLIKLVAEPGVDGTVETVLAVGRDITELYASREKIHRMAYYDQLTSLPNRALFDERLRQAIADTASARRWLIGVMMIDMDRFKGINDTMGHAVGDKLLREAAERLSVCVRCVDTVARFGGDEFAILLPEILDHSPLEDIARTIIDKFDERFVLNGKEVFVSCSIGIALYPTNGVEADDLIKYADSAMYLAKRSGRRSFRFYSKDLTVDASAHLLLESGLRRAIEREELELCYQPKVSLNTNEVIGSEALLRWMLPGVGLVPPNQFIPVAEETGLINDLGKWVLREACRTAAEWNAAGTVPHKVAVNLSAKQFQSPDLASMVDGILDETGCRPAWLELEITESLLLKEDDTILHTLSAFKSMGVAIAIDDFGTGYSALGYLARFPIDSLKIDRSFIQKVTTDRRHAELVKAILSFARCLGLQVVAEGVETAGQAAFLQANGCQAAQGFLYSKPLQKAKMASFPRHLDPDVWAK
ncbi:EAL domain-containing protein [Paraburkholderia fungorum]|nr:EAL domain-containing protein [Paraburkholderia fungorum]